MTEQAGASTTRSALSGTTVIEWSYGRPGAYAGRLLRGFGAEVIVVEPGPDARERLLPENGTPTRDAELAALVRILHGGKRSVAVDPGTTEGRELFEELLARADVLVMDQPLRDADALGLSPEALRERFPNLVVAAMSLYGLDAPRRYHRYSDLVAHAVGGIAYATPKTVPDVETYPPLKPGGYQADYSLGLAAANAALLGLQLRRRTGAGSLFDVSAQGLVAAYMRQDFTPTTFGDGSDSMRIIGAARQAPNRKASTLWGLVPCKDGYFAFQASEQYQWDGLMRMMGNPEWAKEPNFQDPIDRVTYWDDIEPHFIGWTMEHDKLEIFHAAQKEHVPVFPCYSIEELLADEQQVARGFFVDLPAETAGTAIKVPGALIHLEKTPWQSKFDLGAPAPRGGVGLSSEKEGATA